MRHNKKPEARSGVRYVLFALSTIPRIPTYCVYETILSIWWEIVFRCSRNRSNHSLRSDLRSLQRHISSSDYQPLKKPSSFRKFFTEKKSTVNLTSFFASPLSDNFFNCFRGIWRFGGGVLSFAVIHLHYVIGIGLFFAIFLITNGSSSTSL